MAPGSRPMPPSRRSLIEIKLSQGAKPGHGACCWPKVSPEIAEARRCARGQDCVSPAAHSAFSTPLELLQFLDRLRAVGRQAGGFKPCIGPPVGVVRAGQGHGRDRSCRTSSSSTAAEGGTGAAPLEFTDHVGAPMQEGCCLVHNTLVGVNLRHRIKVGCAGRSSAPSTSPGPWPWGPTGATRRAVSCSRWLHPGPALPHRRLPHGWPRRIRSGNRRWWSRTRASALHFHQNTLEGCASWCRPRARHTPMRSPPRTSCGARPITMVRLLAHLPPTVEPGTVLAAARGEADRAAQRVQDTGLLGFERQLQADGGSVSMKPGAWPASRPACAGWVPRANRCGRSGSRGSPARTPPPHRPARSACRGSRPCRPGPLLIAANAASTRLSWRSIQAWQRAPRAGPSSAPCAPGSAHRTRHRPGPPRCAPRRARARPRISFAHRRQGVDVLDDHP